MGLESKSMLNIPHKTALLAILLTSSAVASANTKTILDCTQLQEVSFEFKGAVMSPVVSKEKHKIVMSLVPTSTGKSLYLNAKRADGSGGFRFLSGITMNTFDKIKSSYYNDYDAIVGKYANTLGHISISKTSDSVQVADYSYTTTRAFSGMNFAKFESNFSIISFGKSSSDDKVTGTLKKLTDWSVISFECKADNWESFFSIVDSHIKNERNKKY
jgi:hypothetical protein